MSIDPIDPIPESSNASGETYRLAKLDSYCILDTDPETAYDDITFLAAQICRVPTALISLIDADRQWFKSKVGLDICETARDIAFCTYAIATPDDILVVPDARQDERFADNPLVTQPPHIRFYAGAPLVTPDGYALGTLCVIDYQPRCLSQEQLQALSALSRQVVNQLELRLNLSKMQQEIAARQQIEAEVRQLNTELEQRVQARTQELAFINQQLKVEVATRQNTEQALRQAQKHLRRQTNQLEQTLSGILNSSLDGIMAFQAMRQDGQIVDFECVVANPAAEQLLHRSADSLIGSCLAAALPSQQLARVMEACQQVVETGYPIEQVFCYEQAHSEQWFQIVLVKVGDGFAITFRDVTEARHSAWALQEANHQLALHIEELKQRQTELVALSEMSDFLQICSTFDEACEVMTAFVQPMFGSCSGGIFILDPAKQVAQPVAMWGDLTFGSGVFQPQSCWAMRRGRVHQCLSQHRIKCVHCHHLSAAVTLCIPMMVQGETIGLLHLGAATAADLPAAKQQLARAVAEQLGLAIANLRLRETLQNHSFRDPLTGLFNRRYLEETFEQELRKALISQYPISVILIDIDHFKSFNDRYGHDAGDFVLKQVCHLLIEQIRRTDTACRYGGEELLLVLPGISLTEAEKRAEQLRMAIRRMDLTYEQQPLGILTASLGVACFPDHGLSTRQVIQTADKVLYQAKSSGRDRVIAAPIGDLQFPAAQI